MEFYLPLRETARLLDHALLAEVDARLYCGGLVALKYSAYRPISTLQFFAPVKGLLDLKQSLRKRPQGLLAADDEKADLYLEGESIRQYIDVGGSEPFLVEIKAGDLAMRKPPISVAPGFLALHTEDMLETLFYHVAERGFTDRHRGLLYDLALVAAHELQSGSAPLADAYIEAQKGMSNVPEILDELVDGANFSERIKSNLTELGASAEMSGLISYGLDVLEWMVMLIKHGDSNAVALLDLYRDCGFGSADSQWHK